MSEDLLWPSATGPGDLAEIESVPLDERGLPESTYALLARAARLWPDRSGVTVLPEAARWREPVQYCFAELLAEVHRYANLLHAVGVRRGDAVALLSPNCAELISAALAAQLAGIAAPTNGGLSHTHIAELLRLSRARVPVSAGPELSCDTWAVACTVAADGLIDVLLALRPTSTAGAPPALAPIEGVRVGYLDELAAEHDSSAFAGTPPTATDLLELAAVLGLLPGIAWWSVGAAAGIGLALLMIGAVAAHLRHGDGVREFGPAVVTGLAVGYLLRRVGVLR